MESQFKIRDIAEYTHSEAYPENQKLEIESVLGKHLTLLGVAERSGQYGDFFIADATVDGVRSTFILRGSAVFERIKQILQKEMLQPDENGKYDFYREGTGFAIECKLEKRKFKSGNEGYVLESVRSGEE